MNKSDRKAISSCSSSFRCLSPRYCFLCPCCVSEEQSMLTKTQQYMYFISVPENIFPTTVCLAATIYWCLSNKLNYESAQPASRSYFSAAFVPHLVFPILLNHKQFNLRRPRGAFPLKGVDRCGFYFFQDPPTKLDIGTICFSAKLTLKANKIIS